MVHHCCCIGCYINNCLLDFIQRSWISVDDLLSFGLGELRLKLPYTGGGGDVEDGDPLAATSFSVANIVDARAGGVVVGSGWLAGIGVVVNSFTFSLVDCLDASSVTNGLFSSVGEASGEVGAAPGLETVTGELGVCGRTSF